MLITSNPIKNPGNIDPDNMDNQDNQTEMAIATSLTLEYPQKNARFGKQEAIDADLCYSNMVNNTNDVPNYEISKRSKNF